MKAKVICYRTAEFTLQFVTWGLILGVAFLLSIGAVEAHGTHTCHTHAGVVVHCH